MKKVLVFIGLAFALAATLEIGPEVAMTIESPVVACSRQHMHMAHSSVLGQRAVDGVQTGYTGASGYSQPPA